MQNICGFDLLNTEPLIAAIIFYNLVPRKLVSDWSFRQLWSHLVVTRWERLACTVPSHPEWKSDWHKNEKCFIENTWRIVAPKAHNTEHFLYIRVELNFKHWKIQLTRL